MTDALLLGTEAVIIPTDVSAAYTVGGLRGRLGRKSDGTRGVTVDTGTRWADLKGGVFDLDDSEDVVGDGTADDTVAIQAVIDACYAAGGGVVRVPPRTFRISIQASTGGRRALTLRPNVILRGVHRYKSVLKLVDNQANGLVQWAMLAYDYLGNQDVGGCGLENLTIDQNAPNNPATSGNSSPRWVVYIGRATQPVRFEAVNFDNLDCRQCLYVVAAVNGMEVERCRFTINPSVAATVYHDTSIIYYNSTTGNPYAELIINHNRFYGTTGGAIGYSSGVITYGAVGAGTAIETHGAHQTITYNRIVNMSCGGNLTGISNPATEGLTIAHNRIKRARIGFQIYSLPYQTNTGPLTDLTILDNQIELETDAWSLQNPGFVYARGIYIRAGLAIERLTVAFNKIKYRAVTVATTSGDSPGIGIYLVSIPYRAVNRAWGVTNNKVDSPHSAGIAIQAYIEGLTVADNWVRNAGQVAAISNTYKSSLLLRQDGHAHSVHHNRLVDDQTPPTTKYFINTTALGGALSAPTGLVATQGPGGNLADGTYEYAVTAYNANGDTAPSTTASVTITGGGGTASVVLTWTAVGSGSNGAAGYNVYGRAVGTPGLLDTALAISSPTYTDDGSITPGAAPGMNTTYHDARKFDLLDNVFHQASDPTTYTVLAFNLDSTADTTRAPLIRGRTHKWSAPTGNALTGSQIFDTETGTTYTQTAAPRGTSWYAPLGAIIYPASVPQGVFWGRPDAATMFQSSAGTTAVAVDTDPVGYWASQFADTTLPAALQATAGSRPLYKTNIQNGLPMLLFDASNDFLALDALASLFTGEDKPFTFLAATKAVSTAGTQRILSFGKAAGDTPFTSVDTAAHYGVQRRDDANVSAVQSAGGVQDTACHILSVRFDGTTVTVRVDGVQVASGALNVGTMTLDKVSLGALIRSSGQDYLNGYLGEALLYKAAVNLGDLRGLENFLMQEWLR
jgi:hypothetical protein